MPDSAGTATAIFSGVKTRYHVIGLDGRADNKKCDKKINEISKLSTIANWAQQSGMDTGENFNFWRLQHFINSKRFQNGFYFT